ncbi:MAG: L-threonine 3-dehydrogenase [Planctomycetota bacterium]|nr:L-threonine 3-dehydrogenase [Planctomycetota bacterium]
MAETMRAIRKVAPTKGLTVEMVPIPHGGDHDVLIQVEAASCCGTDLHIWKWDSWAQGRIKPPLTLGHEFAGTVVEVGKRVENVRVGDYVSAESHVTCGMCFQCRTGQAHLCPRTSILGVDREGAFADFVVVPEKVIWQNDREKLPPEVASLQEPFGNAVYVTMGQDITGLSIGVMGCGPIGLFSIAIAKASGVAKIYATDVIDYRLDLARKLQADIVFDAKSSGSEDIIDANDGAGLDLVLEMSGAPQAINTAFEIVRNGGRVILFGIPSNPVEIDVAEKMIFKNLTVLALNGRRIFDTWYKTRWLLESGVVDLRPLISKEITFDQINDAMETLASGEACKIIIRPDRKISPAPSSDGRKREIDPDTRGTVVHR